MPISERDRFAATPLADPNCRIGILIRYDGIDEMRWVIGDIHGMLTPLVALLEEVRARDPSYMLYFVGDYVNRGPDSCGVVEFLLDLPHNRYRAIRGNHDDIFDLILNGKSFAAGSDPVPVFSWFMAHGLDRTLHSYGIDEAMIEHVERKPSPQRLAELVESVPQSHRTFFRHLPLLIEDDDLFVLHAKWRSDSADDHPDLTSQLAQHSKLRQRVLWERFSDDELARKKVWRRRGFFGHTPVINYSSVTTHDENIPIIANRAVLLDTGVALSASGRLTAFCAETDEYVQVDHFGRLVEADPFG